MTLIFLKILALGLLELLPIILFLLSVITILGIIIGKWEKWDKIDALYFAFITATTVGYGDIRPNSKGAKLFSLLIAITGIILTGIIVAISLHAVEASFLAKKG